MEEQLPQTEQPQQVGEIDKLYSVVNQAGLYTKSKDEFLKKYSTPENIDKLHSVVSEAGLYTKPKEDFYKKYYPQIGSVQPTQKQTQQVQTNNPILTQDLSFKNLSKVLPTGGATPSKEGSWKNIVQNVAANLELTGTNVASGAANIVRDAAGLIVKQPDLFDKEGKPTKESKNISWYNDPLGKVIVGLNGNKKRMEGVLENNKLPNTFMGELVTSASQLFPDIAAVAALPETKVPEMASAMSKTIATLGNTFTKYLAAKGLTTSYDEARSQGQSMVEASKKGLTGFIKGAEMGVEMAALGVGSNVATNAVMKQAEKIGLTGAKGVGAKELVNLMTDVTAYGLVSPAAHSAIEGTPLTAHEIANGAGIAAMFRLKGSAETLSKHYELNRALKETQNMRQGVAVANFSDATPESIHEVYKMPESAEELNLKALKFTKEAKETTDLQKKQDLVAKAIMYTKASNVKSVTDNVVNNLNSIDEIANSEEIPNSLKEKFIANANSVLELINNSKQQERVQTEETAPIEQQGVTVIKPEENQPKETIGIGVEEMKPETQKSGVSVVLPSQNRKPNIIEKQTIEVQQPTKAESSAITEVSEVVKPTEKEPKEKVKVFRGVGRNLGEGENEGFNWVSSDKEHASQFSNDGNVSETEIDKPNNTYKFPWARVSQPITGEQLIGAIDKAISKGVKDKTISESEWKSINEKKKQLSSLVSDKIESFQSKVNDPKSSKLISEILSDLGYDAIEVNDEGVINYGIIKKSKEKQTPKEEIKPTEKTRQEKINDLVDRASSLTAMRSNAPERASIKNKLNVEAAEFGLKYSERDGKLVNEKGNAIQKREPITNKTVVKDFDRKAYSKETNDSMDFLADNPTAITGFEIVGTDGKRLSKSQIEQAAKSVKEGKVNYAAKIIFDFIEKAHKQGGIELEDVTTGQRALVPIKEYFDALKTEEDKLRQADIDDLVNNKELEQSDEYINQLIQKYEQEYSQENNESKPTSEGEVIKETSTGTSVKENGKENPESVADQYEAIKDIKSKKAQENAKKELINNNFESIVSQLMLKNKIKRIC